MTVVLRPLRQDEYAAWLGAHADGYAEGLAAFAGLDADEARRKAEADLATVLADGLATNGVAIWAVEVEGEQIGSVFLGIRDEGAWLYDITIDESRRGKGHGRAAMLALEDEVRRLGHRSLGLNVWGGNEIARGLYRSLGFAETSVHMRKEL